MASSKAFVGFPEGMIQDKPARLPVLSNEANWFSLDKFSGLLGQAHPWHTDRPDVARAIRSQTESGKAELNKLSIKSAFYVCGPELEFAGPMIFGKNKDSADHLKNAYGSEQFIFTYRFLTESDHPKEVIECNLPIAMHSKLPRAQISHRTGKKSTTRFRKVARSRHLSLWEAETTHPRMHQIRIHAAESRIPILGDQLYEAAEQFPDSKAHRREKMSFLQRFSGLAAVLVQIDLSKLFPEIGPLVGDLPKQFLTLLRKLELDNLE